MRLLAQALIELALSPTTKGGVNKEMAKAEKREFVQRDTGEVVYALVPVERSRMGRRFFMVMQDAFEHLGKLKLPGRTLWVLHFLLSKLDFQNWIHIEQAEVAKELGLGRADVSRAIRKLEESGVLYRGPKMGRSATYRLDPHFGWKGTVKEHRIALAEAQERGLKVLMGGRNK